MISAWCWVRWAFRQRLGEGTFGLLSEGRGIRQTGVENAEMGTWKYSGGAGGGGKGQVVKVLNALLMRPGPFTKQVGRWSSLWLRKTILAHVKGRTPGQDQGHVYSAAELQLHPYDTENNPEAKSARTEGRNGQTHRHAWRH